MNSKRNDIVVDYLLRLLDEAAADDIFLNNRLVDSSSKNRILNRIDSLYSCNRFWNIDRYDLAKIKDFKKTNLCHDKFCNNCKKVKQAGRMAKFMPLISDFENLYHLTLTIPNVSGSDLSDSIKNLSKSFRVLNHILTGQRHIKGLDLDFELLGCIRSLEVTFKGDTYHPHYHVLLALKSPLNLDKTLINDYSYSYGSLSHKFSDLEILIQKLWFLLINGHRLSKNNIDSLQVGYSCKLDKLNDGDYNEIFKYMTKSIDEDSNILTYENFKVLDSALYRVRQIQGYGCFYNIDDSLDLDSTFYDEFISDLQKKESPIDCWEQPIELISDDKYFLISRKAFFSYLSDSII